uniref:Uncharacterized protein n=1 Tax=Siphoviridae sp. ctHl62 TaxID=2826235 RepID=A0A8S5MG87_9CAUD|nr:MAG TPA: hypothetical protein [Siphoviridae sp. ctHl62]
MEKIIKRILRAKKRRPLVSKNYFSNFFRGVSLGNIFQKA